MHDKKTRAGLTARQRTIAAMPKDDPVRLITVEGGTDPKYQQYLALKKLYVENLGNWLDDMYYLDAWGDWKINVQRGLPDRKEIHVSEKLTAL